MLGSIRLFHFASRCQPCLTAICADAGSDNPVKENDDVIENQSNHYAFPGSGFR